MGLGVSGFSLTRSSSLAKEAPAVAVDTQPTCQGLKGEALQGRAALLLGGSWDLVTTYN